MTFLDVPGQGCLSAESVSDINRTLLATVLKDIVLTVSHSMSGRCKAWCHCVSAGASPDSTTVFRQPAG